MLPLIDTKGTLSIHACTTWAYSAAVYKMARDSGDMAAVKRVLSLVDESSSFWFIPTSTFVRVDFEYLLKEPLVSVRMIRGSLPVDSGRRDSMLGDSRQPMPGGGTL